MTHPDFALEIKNPSLKGKKREKHPQDLLPRLDEADFHQPLVKNEKEKILHAEKTALYGSMPKKETAGVGTKK